MPINHAFASGKSQGGDASLVSKNEWNADHTGTPFGQSYNYPTTFSGDTINGSSTTPFVDVVAFDTKEVLNSRILHLQTKGASKDQKVRVTLGTTKTGVFDVTTVIAYPSLYWSTGFDTYFEVRLSTSGDAQLAVARIGTSLINATSGDTSYWNSLRVDGSGSPITSNVLHNAPVGEVYTVRFQRDGSNVITFQVGKGTAPMMLTPIVDKVTAYKAYTTTVSGTLARVEYSIHTPSGPTSNDQFDAYVDWLASI